MARTTQREKQGGRRDRLETVETDPSGAVVIHPDDRRDPALLVVPGSGAGCCGLDGLDGPNQACANCHSVLGTARTDCWTEKEVRFWPDRVLVKDITWTTDVPAAPGTP